MSLGAIADRVIRMFDGETCTIGVSDVLEHQIHRGKAFFSGLSVTLGPSATYWVTFTTDSKVVHFQAREIHAYDSASAVVSVDVSLHEGVTTNADGTVVPIYNANRNMVLPSVSVMRENDTITDEGLQLPKGNILRSDKKFLSTGGSGVEYIMAESTVYGLKIVNNEAEAVTVDFSWNWSEL